MTAVTHSLPDDVLLAYSAGQLSEPFDLLVATHCSLSDEARARLAGFDAVGGALLEEAPQAEMGAGALEATLAMVLGAAPEPPKARARDALFPAPLHDYVGGGLEAVQWRNAGMGVRQAILSEGDGASVRLLSIPSGVAVPDHGHHGLEMTLVLQGAFRDQFGAFHRGDVEIANEDVEHTPMAFGDETCICLAATDSRLRFNGLLPRLAQPFLRI